METLVTLIPDVEVLLAMAPEELAPILLRLARGAQQRDNFHPEAIVQHIHGDHRLPCYPANRKGAVEIVLNEGWNWLKVNGLVVPDSGGNGQNGWLKISRIGATLNTRETFDSFRQAAAFPKTLLHPSIADRVWLDLAPR